MFLPAYMYCFFTFIMLSSCSTAKPQKIPAAVQSKNENTDNNVQEFNIAYITGKFDPALHPEFSVIPAKYRDEEVRYLRSDVLDAFIKMFDAAAKDGVTLTIKSATRNFDNQKRIWENKWSGKTILENNLKATEIQDDVLRAKKILEYSSMPGSSRHHWGTDIDLNAFENEWFDSGPGKKIYAWLMDHGHTFGFCQPYSKMGSDRHTGYLEEKWHWTYTPISALITEQAGEKLKDDLISGFLGSETAAKIKIVQNYVLAISPTCKQLKN